MTAKPSSITIIINTLMLIVIAWCASPTYAGQLPFISSTTESRGATQLSLLIHQQHQRIYPYLNPIPEGRVSVYNDKYNKNRRPASFYVRSSPQLGPFFGIFTHVYNEDEPCPSECLKENNHTAIPWGQKITDCSSSLTEPIYTAVTNGTITLDFAVGTQVPGCTYIFVAIPPYNKVTATCTDKNVDSEIQAFPATQSQSNGFTVYTSEKNFLQLKLVGVDNHSTGIHFSCTWNAVK